MDRPANDTDSEARVVGEIYLINPTTKKPGWPSGSGGGGGDVNITQVGGVDVEGEIPVADATAQASLSSIDTKVATAEKQDDALSLLNDIAAATTATQAAVESPDPAPIVFDTASMRSGQTAITPKFAVISASTSGNNTLVAAVTGKKIRVLAYNLMTAGSVNVKFQSAAGGADVTGLKTFDAASKGLVAGFNPVGWFETSSGALLNLNLSAAILVGGELVYIEV